MDRKHWEKLIDADWKAVFLLRGKNHPVKLVKSEDARIKFTRYNKPIVAVGKLKQLLESIFGGSKCIFSTRLGNFTAIVDSKGADLTPCISAINRLSKVKILESFNHKAVKLILDPDYDLKIPKEK